MKKAIYISLVLFIVSFTSFSQSYKSLFQKDTTQWNVSLTIPDGGSTEIYYTFNDTFINGQLLHPIINKFIGKPIGYIREDTLFGKYWFIKKFDGDTIELLIMDLSLQKGDKFPIITDYRYMNRADTVIVDSVYFTDNRKVIQLSGTHFDGFSVELPLCFVEGVGPTSGGFMADYYGQYFRYALLCKFDNGKKIFSSEIGQRDNCEYLSTGDIEENKLNSTVKVFPNPSTSKVNVEINNLDYSNADLYIFNSIGNLILQIPITSANNVIELNKSGLYVLQIVTKNSILTQKVIIN